MSQTETLLVLALGSALTFVFFLLFGRIFWNMAMAAGARRRAKEVPVEMLNLQADRDRLRAEHALMARKLELKLDDIKIRMAEQMAEVSRNRNRVQGLLDDIGQRDEELKQRKREIDALTTQLQVKDAELEATQRSVKALEADAAAHSQEMAKLQQSLQKLQTALRSKDALVGELNQELRGLISQPESPSPTAGDAGEPAESRLRRRVAELTSISAEMSRGDTASDPAVASPEAEVAPTPAPEATRAREEQIKEKLAEAERQTEEMQKELRALDEMLAKATGSETGEAEAPKKQGAMANVVSLAQRIRALQKGMND